MNRATLLEHVLYILRREECKVYIETIINVADDMDMDYFEVFDAIIDESSAEEAKETVKRVPSDIIEEAIITIRNESGLYDPKNDPY